MILAEFQVEMSYIIGSSTLKLIAKLCYRLHYVELIASRNFVMNSLVYHV